MKQEVAEMKQEVAETRQKLAELKQELAASQRKTALEIEQLKLATGETERLNREKKGLMATLEKLQSLATAQRGKLHAINAFAHWLGDTMGTAESASEAAAVAAAAAEQAAEQAADSGAGLPGKSPHKRKLALDSKPCKQARVPGDEEEEEDEEDEEEEEEEEEE